MNEQLQIVDVLLAKDEVKKAEIVLAKLLRTEAASDEERAEMLIRRARIRLVSARPEDALDDLSTIAAMRPKYAESPGLLELRADCHFARFELASVGFADRNDTDVAQSLYHQIIRQNPDYANLGWVHYQLGRIKVTENAIRDAIPHFQQALLCPSQTRSLTAYCYERLGFIAFYEERDLEKALAFLSRAIDTYSGQSNHSWLVQVYILRSRVMRASGQYDGMHSAIEQALQIASSSENKLSLVEGLLAAGEMLSDMDGSEREVIQYLHQFTQIARKPLGVDVTWSRVHEMLGNAYFNLGQYENAIQAYQSALQFNPDHPWSLSLYYRIARSYYQQRAYQQVIEIIQRMQRHAQTDGQEIDDYRVFDVLGNSLFALKHYDRAIEAYQTALSIAPPNADSINKIKSYRDLARELI